MQGMGVVVTGPGRLDAGLLPPLPPASSTVNLDVTALCALVSEISNGNPQRPELREWASRVVHWQVFMQNRSHFIVEALLGCSHKLFLCYFALPLEKC